MAQESHLPHVGAGLDGTQKAAPTPDAPRGLAETCIAIRRRVLAFLESQTSDEVTRDTQNHARVSMEVVEDALRKYRPEELALSYNGGKDCLVLLVLILACLPTILPEATSNHETNASDTTETKTKSAALGSNTPIKPIQAIYIAPPDPFLEVEDFVTTSTTQYHLDLARYALPMRAALEAYQADKPAVKAIFMGTRRTDPHSEFLTHFSPTDKGWPQFMRVNPVLDWHYAEIWAFIRGAGIPYCSLYDQGFSSLGGVNNTRPNPALAVEGDETKFRPAYELRHDKEERLGRDR